MFLRIRDAQTSSIPRSAQAEASLAARLVDNGHMMDVYYRVKYDLGKRASVVGRIDLSRNPLRSYVQRLIAPIYRTPPFVDGLEPGLAKLIGDYSGRPTIERYQAAGGYPLPSRMLDHVQQAQFYRRGAGYAGVLIGWSARSSSPYLETVSPADLELRYSTDDPWEPTVIRHYREREVDGRWIEVVDEYDMTDPSAPRFRVLRPQSVGGEDLTESALGTVYSGDAWPWRYADGTPFHRIVVTGHPSHVWDTLPLVEGALNICVDWTHWHAAVRDASHGQRHVVGLRIVGLDSDEATRSEGQAAGPESVVVWEHDDPERPGEHWQDAPPFDPKVIAEALRTYELTLLSAMDIPVAYERTGGEPTETERRALAGLIRAEYATCRHLDSEVLRRLAALVRVESGETYSEEPHGVSYREEIPVKPIGADVGAETNPSKPADAGAE